jgi:putative membrane protein
MKILFLILKGTVIGGANVMPGVSGATLAVILRIYDSLIEAVNNLFTDMKESLKLLIPVVIGMVIGILAVGVLADFLLQHFSLQTGGFIAGLMAGSLPFIHSQATLKADKNNMYKYYLIAAIAAIAIVLLTLLAPDSAAAEAQGAVFSAGLAVHLFIGGAFAAAALVIPGISGAMVLILFGLYPLALHTIKDISEYLMSPMDFQLLPQILTVVLPLGFGIVAGILLGSKLIATLLKKFHGATYFAIFGLILGTVFAVFYNPDISQRQPLTPMLILFTLLAFACGAAASLRLARK